MKSLFYVLSQVPLRVFVVKLLYRLSILDSNSTSNLSQSIALETTRLLEGKVIVLVEELYSFPYDPCLGTVIFGESSAQVIYPSDETRVHHSLCDLTDRVVFASGWATQLPATSGYD